jgi:TPR repeat protein
MTRKWIPTAYRENRLYNSSLALLDGRGVRQDEAAAFALNAEAAEQGHHDAVLAMGWFYLNGVGVEKDRERSWYWYRKSARHGDPRAMFSLGYLCWLERDYIEANTWFARAIGAGHLRSQYWLAKLLWKGLGVAQDAKRARSLIEQAAKANVLEAKRALRFLTRPRPNKALQRTRSKQRASEL